MKTQTEEIQLANSQCQLTISESEASDCSNYVHKLQCYSSPNFQHIGDNVQNNQIELHPLSKPLIFHGEQQISDSWDIIL
ncbi:hypothetical protein SS50377_20464 [Spironucleus salmonicida]|uniref:Uncharacterized protein n=1 Tax=Spironucleus salmonicida TaxID=348837 RepID=V6LXS4_9EUKA|nr:hypothetical protein SS50377_20464 [Spironucleus salmonicida]|eukprot:EST45614.1 Hypothetical protein SS50377_14468 [Spironucleus salmonicida]